MTRPLIAVVADTRDFEGYRWHAAPQPYLHATLTVAGITPLVVPSFGDRLDVEAVLDAVDGVLLTGSKTNVHPSLYGAEATEAGGPHDEARDATAIPLALAALARGMPLLAICRGMQELNVALGGTLASELQDQPGRIDHRAPESAEQKERFAIRQPVELAGGGCLASLLATDHIQVNSLHRQGVDRLAPPLAIDATATDGVVEAVTVTGAKSFALGVQWHPEYWAGTDPHSTRIFEAFGDAVRGHHAGRHKSFAA